MKPIFKFSILLMVMFACHRDKVDFAGPATISAPEGFAATGFTAITATPPSVNFITDKVLFNATFTSSVSWIITIIGQKSGAVHEIKGLSKGFNNIIWTGKNDGSILFSTGETVTATLSFYGIPLTSSTTVNITGVPNYSTCGIFAKFGDFESPPKIGSPNWNRFMAVGSHQGVAGHNANGAGLDSLAIDRHGNPVQPFQGNNYYCIKGLGTQSVFVDGIQALKFQTPTPLLPADPNHVWVNMYIYGSGDANAGVDLEYQEADVSNGPPPNYQGTEHSGYQPAEDDAWVAHITLDHIGWKLFSFRYGSLGPSSDILHGGNGNKIQEPNKLQSFDLILLKRTDPNSPVEVYFDFPIITVGGPFTPCK
jgi:hypothetical protein